MTRRICNDFDDPWEYDDEYPEPLEYGTAFFDPSGELVRSMFCPKCKRELFAVPVSVSGIFWGTCYKCKRTTAYEIRPTSRGIGFTSDFNAAEPREGGAGAESACARSCAPPRRRKR